MEHDDVGIKIKKAESETIKARLTLELREIAERYGVHGMVISASISVEEGGAFYFTSGHNCLGCGLHAMGQFLGATKDPNLIHGFMEAINEGLESSVGNKGIGPVAATPGTKWQN